MKHFVPVTKLLGTVAFSFWALVLHTPGPLAALVVIELVLLGFTGNIARNFKAARFDSGAGQTNPYSI